MSSFPKKIRVIVDETAVEWWTQHGSMIVDRLGRLGAITVSKVRFKVRWHPTPKMSSTAAYKSDEVLETLRTYVTDDFPILALVTDKTLTGLLSESIQVGIVHSKTAPRVTVVSFAHQTPEETFHTLHYELTTEKILDE